MESEAEAEVEDECEHGDARADSAARAFAAGADFFGDQTGEQREKDSGEKNCEDPEVKRGKPVEGEAVCGKRPEEFDAGGLANVECEMKEGSGEGGEEDSGAGYWILWGFGFEKQKEKSAREGEDKSGGERVKVSAIEREIGGRTEVGAEEVGVGDDAAYDDRDGGSAGEAREGGALQSERSKSVGEGVHRGKVISYKRAEMR